MYAVSFIYSNFSPRCFPFSSFQGRFFSLQGKWHFFTVTNVEDFLFRRTYRFPYRPHVRIVFTIGNSVPSRRIFTIWHVAVWQRSMRRPLRVRMINRPPFVINRLSLGGGSRGGVFQKCSDIYTPPPQTAPYQGMLNGYFPS